MSSRLNRKHPGSHSRKSSTSTEAKTLKIVKLPSSTENVKLETLYSPNKGSPKVIKSHEDSDNSKIQSAVLNETKHQASIDVEFNYLFIGIAFIEIGQKLIELWSCDVFA
jgi:hypothetical protein